MTFVIENLFRLATRYFHFFTIILFIALFILPEISKSQCVVINECLINGPGACDGSCNPNTEEWTELYDTCNTPIDISCWVLTTGRFSATIPGGTTIPAHGFYVIGSKNSPGGAGIVNLDIGTCNCTTGTLIGTFSNGADQVIILDNLGNIQDAIYWGNGARFPLSITPLSIGACSPATFNLAAPNSSFETVPATQNSNGCVVARICDGSPNWQVRCGAAITIGTTNGKPPFPDFTVSDSNICTGACINFTDLTTGSAPVVWNWTFNGAGTTSSSQNPTNICYNTTGKFDVELIDSNACGTFPFTKTMYITVNSGQAPVITASGPTSFCPGDSVVLQTTATGSFNWNLNGKAINGATNAQYTASTSGSYTLTLTSGTCSGTSNAIVVSNSSLPSITITAQGDTAFCKGGNVVLNTGTIYSTYQWNLNGNPINGATHQQLTVTAGGIYSLTASNGSCSGISDSITVTILPSPATQITAQGSTTLCAGGSVVLDGGSGFSSYQWLLNGNTVVGATNELFTASKPGNYQVSISNTNGCLDTSAIQAVGTISANPPVISSSTGNFSICPGSVLTLKVSNSFSSYQWYVDSTAITGATTDEYSTSAAGNYSVIVFSSGGCSDTTAVVNVIFSSTPVATVTPQGPDSLCVGGSITLQAGNAAAYQWLLNNTPITGATNNSYIATAAGNYNVVVANANGCTNASATTTIIILPGGITVNINASANNLCEGQAAVLSIDSGNYTAIEWSTMETTPTISVTQSGEYKVTVSNGGGCSATDSIDMVFNPLPEVNAGPDVTTDCDQGVQLSGRGAGTLSWQPSKGLSNPAIAIPIATVKATTTYTLTATLGNCTATDTVTVFTNCDYILVPNAFSPNGDGINDVFKVIDNNNIARFDMKIFNRWGELVFESNNPGIGWNGTYNNQPADVGAYVWVINATNSAGTKLLYNGRNSGNVTLLR